MSNATQPGTGHQFDTTHPATTPLPRSSGRQQRKGPPNFNSPKLAYCVEEAAHLLSVKRDTIYELLHRKQLGSFKIGKRRLIAHRQLEEFVEAEINR